MGKRTRVWVVTVAVALVLAFAAMAAQAQEGFPLRAKFPKVKYMTTEELAANYASTIVVDVRSKIEFEVIHIAKAVHIPVSTAMFTKDLVKARAMGDATPIAFYCNGHTCAKSYEAAEQAAEAGFKNVFAYDAGIYDWVKAHPDKGALMGATPVPLDKLISKDALAQRMISYDEFQKRAGKANVVVVDIREPFQRQEVPKLSNLRNIPSDRFADLLKKGEFKSKELLILDAVGKQVQWIQYYLEQNGYADYAFLKKGVEGAK